MPKVIVYSTENCPFCLLLKDFLKNNNIEFQSFDVGQQPKKLDEMVAKSGQTAVPVIDIDGQIIVGFDEIRIKQALGLKA